MADLVCSEIIYNHRATSPHIVDVVVMVSSATVDGVKAHTSGPLAMNAYVSSLLRPAPHRAESTTSSVSNLIDTLCYVRAAGGGYNVEVYEQPCINI